MIEALKAAIRTAKRSFFWPRDCLFCAVKGLPWSKSWRFHGLPIVSIARGARISIGAGFICTSDPKMNSIGIIQKSNLRVGRSDAELIIGKDVGMSGATLSSSLSIQIGDRVLIGSGCLISDSDAHPLHPQDRADASKIGRAPISIGNDCFLGARSIVLKGVRIGEGSVIGAGSVVVSDIPAGVIAAGNPAKVIRSLETCSSNDDV